MSGKSSKELLLSQNADFFESFYSFVEETNPDMANCYPLTPKYRKKITADKFNETVLNYIAEKYETDYYLMQLKYYVNYYKQNLGIIKNVVFIFDDIEALNVEHHHEAIEMAYNIKKCMSAYLNKDFDTKTLISLRNYVFRSNQQRQKSAFREIPDCDCIIKTETPKLSDVVLKRTQAILSHKKTVEGIVDMKSWDDASKSLIIILTKLYGSYDDILMKLSHNNLFKAMQLLLRIITNKKYLGKNEIYGKDGSFVIDPKIYDLSNSSTKVITNSDVFNSLAYGEGEYYFDYGDFYLPNILHYSKKCFPNSRILSLYILRYFQVSQEHNNNSLYGIEYEIGSKVISSICDAFDRNDIVFYNQLQEDLKKSMSYLFSGGVLLQSIKDIEHKEDEERIHYENDKLYLSLRGQQLISMLESNALLLEVYRNDIDTDLHNNNILSVNMRKEDSLLYCIQYTRQLFESEVYYINKIRDAEQYFTAFGNDFIVCTLIKGLKQSINVFYETSPAKYGGLKNELNKLVHDINCKADEIRKANNIKFNRMENDYGN